MNKIFYYLLTFFLVASLNTYAQASEHNQKHEKVRRGFTNLGTAPLEIPKQIGLHWKQTDRNVVLKTAAVLPSSLKGVLFMATRFGSGLWDIVTFNLPLPHNYEPILKPDYVVESWNDGNTVDDVVTEEVPEEN